MFYKKNVPHFYPHLYFLYIKRHLKIMRHVNRTKWNRVSANRDCESTSEFGSWAWQRNSTDRRDVALLYDCGRDFFAAVTLRRGVRFNIAFVVSFNRWTYTSVHLESRWNSTPMDFSITPGLKRRTLLLAQTIKFSSNKNVLQADSVYIYISCAVCACVYIRYLIMPLTGYLHGKFWSW